MNFILKESLNSGKAVLATAVSDLVSLSLGTLTNTSDLIQSDYQALFVNQIKDGTLNLNKLFGDALAKILDKFKFAKKRIFDKTLF